ncbi:NACHT domain-containing protein [Actinomadura kijaniata]|uniref:NACHT domain-containing protein n=1 Tax=Actinomadura kijaniata TaxID=46161 RepID=UPI000A4E14A7|nr:NACHT domain-containing protein [Actinomadura kijaniata]
MAVEAAALGVGRAVVQLAVGRWLAGHTARRAAGRDLVELVETGFPDTIKRRRVTRQFEAIADAVTDRLLTFAGHEFGGLSDGDRAAVLDQVVRTLQQADLSDEALWAADLDPVRLSRGLRSRLPERRAGFEFGEAGARLYAVALNECCDCLARIIIHLPQFEPRAAVEMLGRLTGLGEQLEGILSRLPARSLDAPEGTDDDAEFTRRYLASISESLDTLELFGVRFERFTRPQTRLSVAYISLSVSEEDGAKGRRSPTIQAVPIDEFRSTRHDGGTRRVEAALSGHRLMLLRGEAGGGKSTLLRWLAVTAARGAFTGELADWNGVVPFLIKLRHADELPRPEQYLDTVAGNLVGIMPRGWVHRQLRSGRALLMVDGVDEVPAHRRQAVRDWLRGIVNEFRDLRIIVTSRPAAARADWLRAEGFATAFLEPLSPPGIRALVRHWHDAVRGRTGLPCAPERLPSYEARLHARLEGAPHLRALASSPLLAAMLCALNLDRETLPHSRMELYRAALEMLLETRDAKRGVPSARTVSLEPDQKIRILQNLAWYLSDSNRVELPKPTVQRLTADRLAAMPRVDASAEDVLDALLQRSGVLREPVPDRIDFVHRTVQEYLTAKQAADLGDMDLLVHNAHRDQWRETIIMAAGHANEPLCRELITGILSRAAAEPRHARRLKLLAVSCLETLPALPEDLRAALDACLDELVPPRSVSAARSLASAGEPVLAKLPRTLTGLSDAAACAAIRTAWMVNGPKALDLLAGYAADRRTSVWSELNDAWGYFDPDEFAARVLNPVPGHCLLSVVRSPARLRALTRIPPLRKLYALLDEPSDLDFLVPHARTLNELTILCDQEGVDIGRLPPLPDLDYLVLGLPGLTDLRFLDDLPKLGMIWLPHCEEIKDFSPLLRHSRLRQLGVRNSVHLTDLASLPPLSGLLSLNLTGSRLSCGLEDVVAAAPMVEMLYLSECAWVRDLAPLRALPLRQLDIGGCAGLSDLAPLADLSGLGHLDLSGTPVRDLTPLTGLSGLFSLKLDGCPGITDLSPLARLPRLDAVWIRNLPPGTDVSPLAHNPKLTSVYIAPGQEVTGAEKLGRRLKVW